ncbi:hypothetical protein J3R30DRAFT_1239872 [Lentinula aciculospora]|uniref:Uncharacterized protein n=1 Tax=Lentinula aciculospora TaxID=153920 RepID=A0A9W8ZYJ2_9AGAR|nr:hypothetical protein J3R30DRAFT_1239872 [Lentinula aciculospora]
MKFSISATYVVLSFFYAYVNVAAYALPSNSATGVSSNDTATTASTNQTADVGSPTTLISSAEQLSRRSAISITFSNGAPLSAKEISENQQAARDKVQNYILAAKDILHSSGSVINWANQPPSKVKPEADKIKFEFTGPAICTGGTPAPSSGRMQIERRDADSGFRRDRMWKRAGSKGCSGFVKGETGEIQDSGNKVIYPV